MEYVTTYLQEIPQKELDEAPGGNNLQYIYYSVLMSLLLVTRV